MSETSNSHDVTLLGGLGEKKSNGVTQWYMQLRVYDMRAVAVAIPAEQSFHPYYGWRKGKMESEHKNESENKGCRLRIRKLTEGECYRLMGFEEKDTEACREAGQSASNIYHQAGDSIVTTVLVGIFGELIGVDPRPVIEEYADKLHEETLS